MRANEVGEKDKMRGYAEHLNGFPNEIIKFSSTGARMQDSICHMITEPRNGLSCAHKLVTPFNNIITHLNDLLCRMHKLIILF